MLALASGAGLVAPSARSLPRFRLVRPSTIVDAVAAHAEAGEGAVYHCGGTDLVAQFREGLQPSTLVALGAVRELTEIDSRDGSLLVGAGVDHHAGSSAPLVCSLAPSLAEAWGRVANVRIRLRATIGGNVMSRRPRYEMSVLLSALDARLHFQDTDGAHVYTVADVWDGLVPQHALMTRVEIPRVGAARFAYDRSLRPTMTLAVALREQGQRLLGRAAIGSEYRPVHAADFSVEHSRCTEEDLADLATRVMDSLPDTIGDAVVSARYRRRAGAVLLHRRLLELTRAG